MKHNSRGDDSLIFDHSNDETGCLKRSLQQSWALNSTSITLCRVLKSKIYKGWAIKYWPLIEVNYVKKIRVKLQRYTLHPQNGTVAHFFDHVPKKDHSTKRPFLEVEPNVLKYFVILLGDMYCCRNV